METTMTNKQFHDKVSMNFYHLDPRWCSHKDFDYVVDSGMVNSLRLTMDAFDTTYYGCKKAKENGMPVWLVPPIFLPSNSTIEEYIEKLTKYVDKLKDRDVWDTVVGFQWDEPLLRRGHTNDDLLTMTKAVSEAFGKRIFVNFSLYEIAGKRGNDGDPDFQWLLRKDCSKYITDVGYDLYGFDMRPENQDKIQANLQRSGKQHGTEFKTATDLYEYFTNVTLDLMENKDTVRVWYYPCAYDCQPHGAIPMDEGYAIGHLEGYTELLKKQKNPGGLCVFTYKGCLDDHIHPKCDREKWDKYVEVCKKLTKEFNEMTVNL